jgi:hypothetical protein
MSHGPTLAPAPMLSSIVLPPALAAAGWHLGPPDLPHVPALVFGADDAASTIACDACGHPGLTFVPCRAGRVLRGFMACPACGEARTK